MDLKAELDAFVEQTLDKYEGAHKKFGGGYFVKKTWLEPYMRKNLQDLYLQLKFICENLSRDVILEREYDSDKSMMVFRRSRILQKIAFNPWTKLKDIKEDPFFMWQDQKEEFTIEEYIDIIMSEVGFLFEHYFSNLQNNVTFNCTELARGLGLNGIISHITRADNLKQLYDSLSSFTNATYSIQTDSFFPPKFYEVRCAVFHMDYYYEKLPPTNFKIYLNADKTLEIKFDELIELTKDIINKINVIKIVPHWFAISNSCLPLKG